ncbi:hypothetical protein FQA39_LY03127 [Lamprigera yunnana]|nr:hypothetical protein FQA39_LY03127 [Lamprigera yunnana]
MLEVPECNRQQLAYSFKILIDRGINKKIVHKCFVNERTFILCDRGFAVVEKKKTVCNAITLKKQVEVIVTATKKKPTRVVNDELHDLKTVAHINAELQMKTLAKFKLPKERLLLPGGLLDPSPLQQGTTVKSFKHLTLPTAPVTFSFLQKLKFLLKKLHKHNQEIQRTAYFACTMELTTLLLAMTVYQDSFIF